MQTQWLCSVTKTLSLTKLYSQDPLSPPLNWVSSLAPILSSGCLTQLSKIPPFLITEHPDILSPRVSDQVPHAPPLLSKSLSVFCKNPVKSV